MNPDPFIIVLSSIFCTTIAIAFLRQIAPDRALHVGFDLLRGLVRIKISWDGTPPALPPEKRNS